MVPKGWVKIRLGSVAELQRGFDLPSSQREDGCVPIVSSGCSGLMKPDIYLGDNVRHKEVLYDKQTTYFYSRIQTRSR